MDPTVQLCAAPGDQPYSDPTLSQFLHSCPHFMLASPQLKRPVKFLKVLLVRALARLFINFRAVLSRNQ